MKIASFLLLPGLLAAQMGAPNPGFVRFAGAGVESALGLPGNLLLVPSAFPNADAIAFSNRLGLVASAGRIRLVQTNGTVLGEAEYNGVAPVLNVDRQADSALAWIPSERVLLYWQSGNFERAEAGAVPDQVTSVALVEPHIARLFTANVDGTVSAIDVSLPSGTTRNATVLPGAHAPAYTFGTSLIYTDADGLQIERVDGKKCTLAAPARSFTAERMSSDWVHLYFATTKTHYALHLSGEPTLSQLPAPATKVAK